MGIQEPEVVAPHVIAECPKHEVLKAIQRAHKVYVATIVAPGARTTYINISKNQARDLMTNYPHAFTRSEKGNLYIGPASRTL